MSDIKVPSWTLPILAGVIPACIAWGTMQAQAQSTQEDLDRIRGVVEKTAESAQETGQLSKVNEAKIEAIESSLADQAETAKESDEKLQQLIEIMLQRAN